MADHALCSDGGGVLTKLIKLAAVLYSTWRATDPSSRRNIIFAYEQKPQKPVFTGFSETNKNGMSGHIAFATDEPDDGANDLRYLEQRSDNLFSAMTS